MRQSGKFFLCKGKNTSLLVQDDKEFKTRVHNMNLSHDTPSPSHLMKTCSCEVNFETESAEHAQHLVPDSYCDIQTSAMAVAM